MFYILFQKVQKRRLQEVENYMAIKFVECYNNYTMDSNGRRNHQKFTEFVKSVVYSKRDAEKKAMEDRIKEAEVKSASFSRRSWGFWEDSILVVFLGNLIL